MILRKLHSLGLAASLLVLASLGGCGGGGGSEPSPPNNNGDWLTFSPAAPVLTTYEGEEPVPFTITANVNKIVSSGTFNVAVIDTKGVIAPKVELQAMSELVYEARLETAANLPPGTYSTQLEIRLCKDTPTVCNSPLQGSPWYVPLTVTVKTKAQGAARVTITPGTVDLSAYPNENPQFTIEAKFSGDLVGKQLSIGIKDPSLLASVPELTITPDGVKAVARAETLQQPGIRQGNLELHICKDFVGNCREPIAGSPWIIPYKLTVAWTANLSPLQPLAGLTSWNNYQRDAGHTGYVPLSVDAAKINRRWSLPASEQYGSPRFGLVHNDGLVFVLRGGRHFEGGVVQALRELDGSVAWSTPFDKVTTSTPIAIAQGRVYLPTSGQYEGAMQVFDQKTGAFLHSVPNMDKAGSYFSPTVFGNDVYKGSDYPGGRHTISKYLGGTSFAWQASKYLTGDGWSPAVDANYAYVYGEGALQAFDSSNGGLAYRIIGQTSQYTPNSLDPSTPVLSGQMAYVVANGELVAFNLASRTKAWSHPVEQYQSPVVAKGVVYIMRTNTLHAYAADTGALLWTGEQLPNTFGYARLILTDTLAFATGTSNTVAIDLATRKPVWSYMAGGDLSISAQGVLYIGGSQGQIAAFNLK